MKNEITAFRGYRYDASVTGDIGNLLAPPYDVISAKLQEKLYGKSDYNVVRLILGKTFDEDTDKDNRYSRTAKTLEEWIARGALKRDDKPAIYVYAQTYSVAGEDKTRIGFIARKRLEEFGGSGSVLPHEKTLAGPKKDRLNLTRACRCNFSQIFGLYRDMEKITDSLLETAIKAKPDMDATIEDGTRHRLWAVTDEEWIARLTSAMENKKVFIADGHHRYETALAYLNENSSQKGGAPEDIKYVMMYLTNTESEGLTILPTHRVAHSVKNFDMNGFLDGLSRDFEVESANKTGGENATASEALGLNSRHDGKTRFGLYCGGGKYFVLTYKNIAGNGTPLGKLDVAILHNRILEPLLGIGPKELSAQSNVYYSTELKGASERVDAGSSQLAFFLNPTPIGQLVDVAEAGLKMPQKSTYFYPKLISGMVINPLYQGRHES